MADQQTKTILILLILMILLLASFILVIIELFRRNQRLWRNRLQNTKNARVLKALIDEIGSYRRTLELISTEIHDNVSLTLTLSKLYLHTLNDAETGDMHDRIKTSVCLIGKAIRDLNTLSMMHSQNITIQGGLIESIEEEISNIRKTGIFSLSLNIEGKQTPLPPNDEFIILRIIQESLNNTLKHSFATEVSLKLLYSETNLTVRIEDNGIGFDTTQKLPEFSGQGLKNMKNRAETLQAQFQLNSRQGKGTTILIIIPINHH